MKTFALTFSLTLAVALGSSFAQTGRSLPGEGMVSLDFHDVDIQDVVKSVSEITGRNFVLDDKVKGRVTIVSPSAVTIKEAYQVFLSALEVKGFCTVDVGRITKIVAKNECAVSAVPVESDLEKDGGDDQFLTRIIPLKFANANEVRQLLEPLRSRNAKIQADGVSNRLFITDSRVNIRRFMQIIQKIDLDRIKPSVEMIPLRYAQAGETAQKLLTIFDAQKREGGRRRARTGDVEGIDEVSLITADERTNSLLVVATREGLERVLDLLPELDRKVEIQAGVGKIHVKKLEHADAEEMAGLLSSLVSGTSSAKKSTGSKSGQTSARRGFSSAAPLPWEEGGSDTPFRAEPSSSTPGAIVAQAGGLFQDEVRIVADPGKNALVITASPSDYQSLLPVIEQLDTPRPQVFVETLIMEVNIDKALEVSMSGHGASGIGAAAGALGATNLGGVSSIAASQDPSSLAKSNGLILGGSGKTFRLPGTNLSLPIGGALFRAYQEAKAFNVLSAPNILTMDNKKAEIDIVKNISFSVAQQSATTAGMVNSYSREKVGLRLAVTPQINEGDSVTLEIEQKIEDPDLTSPGAGGNVTTNERSAKTTVIAENAQTIVIGGLIRDTEQKTVSKVPLLGDIPLVGHLFRSTSVNKQKQNLVIFLTPHVIHDPKDLTRVSVKKNEERRKFYKSQGLGENKALYDYDLDRGLNMAPPEKRVKEDATPRRRFDYDAPDESAPEASAPEETVSRRPSRKPSSQMTTADPADAPVDEFGIVRKTPRKAKPASVNGNPFSDVRPPSSNVQ